LSAEVVNDNARVQRVQTLQLLQDSKLLSRLNWVAVACLQILQLLRPRIAQRADGQTMSRIRRSRRFPFVRRKNISPLGGLKTRSAQAHIGSCSRVSLRKTASKSRD